MRFGPDHYVPVLKIKRGEKTALSLLLPGVLTRLTPLLEVVETRGRLLGPHLETAFTKLDVALKNVSVYFLDARELAPEAPQGAKATFSEAGKLGIPFVPVTGLSRLDAPEAIKAAKNGIALRLTRLEFDEGSHGGLAGAVRRFLRKYNLSENLIDLMVDLGPVDDMVIDGIRDLARAFLGAVPNALRWRTLTMLGSAFPKSMGVLDRDSHNLVDRNEWLAWRDELYANRRSLQRLPTFGDCAIQHPTGVEGFDPRIMKASAAIRYALDEKWLLVKGVSTGVMNPSSQFPKLSKQIVNGRLRSYFSGASHCPGCDGMSRCAHGAPKLGSAEAWRRLGTMHHLTRTTEQIARLAWP